MITDTCDGMDVDMSLREDDVMESSTMSRLGQDVSCLSQNSPVTNGSMMPASSHTLQPRHNRPTDFIHRTRDAGHYTVMKFCWVEAENIIFKNPTTMPPGYVSVI